MTFSGQTTNPEQPKVVVCSTAWKAGMTPDEANRLIAGTLAARFPAWNIETIPMSDGGDGWLESIRHSGANTREQTVNVTGPLPGRHVDAKILLGKSRVYIEAAEIHGIRRLSDNQTGGLAATSYGVGEALMQLLRQHPETGEVVISVGGSASTDGGLGFLQALGWRFYNGDNREITDILNGGNIHQIDRIKPAGLPENFPKITLLTDVETKYTDAPRIFGPQKGVAGQDIHSLVQAFEKAARLINAGLAERPGSGAAGGLGYGIMAAFPDVTVESGIGWTARETALNRLIEQADLVITGEGRFDDTSLMGKGTGHVIRLAKKRGIPAVVVCGQTAFEESPAKHLTLIPLQASGTPITPEIIADTPQKLTARLLETINIFEKLLEDT